MRRNIKRIFYMLVPFYKKFLKYKKTKLQGSYRNFLHFHLFGGNTYWYKNKYCIVANLRNVYVGINSSVGREGNYIQGAANIYIGNYVRIATNVGILTSNHDLYDHRKSYVKPIKIGDYSWLV